MNLRQVLEKFPNISLARPEDDARIKDFLKTVLMKMPGLWLRYEICAEVTRFLSYQGSEAFIFLMEDDASQLGGYAVLSKRFYYLNGQVKQVAYLSDLRVGSDLPEVVRQQWRDLFAYAFQHIDQIDEIKDCEFSYCAIFDSNKKAIERLAENRFGMVFKPSIHYQAVNIVGKGPHTFLFKSKPHRYRVSFARQSDKENIMKFLSEQNQKKFLGEFFTEDGRSEMGEWQRRELSWHDLAISAFLLVKNHGGEIVGLCCPWSPEKGRKIVLERVPLAYRSLRPFLKLWDRKPLVVGQPLRMLYLTHLEVDDDLNLIEKREVFSALLNFVFDNKIHRPYHFVTFCHFYDAWIDEVLRDYLLIRTPGTIYQIYHQDHTGRDSSVRPIERRGFSFESAVV
jgi:hypothetical protein